VGETSIIIAGIGGQGVQLLSKILARAALAEGRHVMLSSEYGGEMRGGRSFASVVVGDGPLRSLPVVDSADMAIVLHEKHWEHSDHILKPGGLAFVEGTFLDAIVDKSVRTDPPRRFVSMTAIACANAVGSTLGGGLALLSGFCAHTALANTDSLVSEMAAITPPYRAQHVAPNERAIRSASEQCLTILDAPVTA
jgi:2-oxoglutarate ferredoxin oxidoreductase subunit gamma